VFQHIDWASLEHPQLFINGDCMEYMKTMPDKYVDLAICDPPYGIGESKKQRKNAPCKRWKSARNDIPYIKKEWDGNIPSGEYFNQLKRVSKNQIVWGGNYMTEHLHPSMGWIFWDKKNGDTDFSDGELAWTSFDRAMRKFEWMWAGFKKEKPEKRIHPTQKPVALYAWILKNYAKPGDKILDTHVGSASSLIACHNYGFEYIGFEIDKDYYKAAQERLNAHKAQISMFEEANT
jgi:site-specific DNA-methyltransferase (adenine-specific)